jgi:hypothetical protein
MGLCGLLSPPPPLYDFPTWTRIRIRIGMKTMRIPNTGKSYSSPIPHLFAGEEVLGLCCCLTADVLDEAVALALPRHLGDHQEAGRHATITSNIKV